jgi:CRP/FNR family transcriptional regulator, nitrogen oxide reductase regulator
MQLATQSVRSTEFQRNENGVVKATPGTASVEESRVPNAQPAAQSVVGRNFSATRVGNLNRVSSPSEIAFIRRLKLFDDVSPENFYAILSRACKKHLRRHERVFSVGDPIEHVVLLLSGCVKMTQQGLRGNKAILRLTGVGEVVATRCLTPGCKYGSTAQAVQPCTALVWDAVIFDKLLDSCAIFQRNMLRALEECLQKMEDRYRIVSTENVPSRLSRELIRSSKYFARVDGHPAIHLSRSELAQLTGATLWSVSRLLCRWQEEGILSIGRETVEILDLPALERSTSVDLELSQESRS